MRTEAPSWPFSPNFNSSKERAIQVASRIQCEGLTWRQAIAMALIDNANRAIQIQNGQVHLDAQDPQYRALHGYRAAMEAILQREGFETSYHGTSERMSNELIEDIRPDNNPAWVEMLSPERQAEILEELGNSTLEAVDQIIQEHGFTTGKTPGSQAAGKELVAEQSEEIKEIKRYFRKTTAEAMVSGELMADIFHDDVHAPGVRYATLVALEYHLKAVGVQDAHQLADKGLIYMFGDLPNFLEELSAVLPRPTLMGRIQAIRDHTILAGEIKKLNPQAA